MSYYPDFAELLDQYLSAQERSGAWLAQRLEVNPATVTRWRNGDSRPNRPEVVIQIADVLRIHGDERQRLLHAAGYGYLVTAGQEPIATPAKVATDGGYTTVESVTVAEADTLPDSAEASEKQPEAEPAPSIPFPPDPYTRNRVGERLHITIQKTVAPYRLHITVTFLALLIAVIGYGVAINRLSFRSEANVLYFGIEQWQNLTPGQSPYALILSAGTRDILYAKLSQAPQL